jgi:dTDP-4-amino-4,6-dideoxygalactose transaminase
MQRGCKPATLDGAPAFVQPVVVGRPWLPDREQVLRLIGDVLDSGRLSNGGPYVVELERRIAELHQVRHCVATCNGTLALELMLRAAQLTGEVVVPSFSFIATAHAVSRAGLVPVFADVDPVTHNLDPAAVERCITDRTSAILGVHLWGRACDVDGLSAVAERYGLQLLFDAAHAFGCSHRGRMIGGFGRAEAFSFHATKFFHTIEGGAVMTDDDDIAECARRQRNFGFGESLNSVIVGGNAKLNEISAAVGLSQLDGLDELAAVNRSRYELYCSEMQGVRGIDVVEYPALERSNYQYVAIEVNAREAGIDRDGLLEFLVAENVIARPYFSPPCHLAAAYSNGPTQGLEETERLARCTLALPTGPAMSFGDVRTVCDLIKSVLEPNSYRADRRHLGFVRSQPDGNNERHPVSGARIGGEARSPVRADPFVKRSLETNA